MEFKNEVKNKVIGYLVASFGLVAGLAWNDAIKTLIETLFPLSRNTVTVKFVYAILITAVVVFISLYVIKMFKSKEEEKK